MVPRAHLGQDAGPDEPRANDLPCPAASRPPVWAQRPTVVALLVRRARFLTALQCLRSKWAQQKGMLELGSGDIYQSATAGARRQVPRAPWIVDELPKGPTGKIVKREIVPPADLGIG